MTFGNLPAFDDRAFQPRAPITSTVPVGSICSVSSMTSWTCARMRKQHGDYSRTGGVQPHVLDQQPGSRLRRGGGRAKTPRC